MQWGVTSVPHGVSPVAAQGRAAICLRWAQYWFNHWGADREVDVVNMDATVMGAAQHARAGMTDCCSAAEQEHRSGTFAGGRLAEDILNSIYL